ncbi:C-type lectin domain family 2 member D-like isoform 5-T5 [Anomaloglossus baeobatrachus]|uniref:C-type lectin domain family 2 member D-like isoform X3 n=1 Tax=Anomaloglossus baeobatrachus TaxID=238106 RepID=UPI003F502A6A
MGPTPEEATEAAMCVAEQLDSVKSSLTGDVEYKPKKCHDKCQSPNSKITLPDSRDPCEDGWIWYMRKCYYFSTNISEWENSQDFCASKNASLAIIDRKYELDFILRFKGSSDHWIGLRRENESKPWVWTNGSIYDNNMFPIVGFSNCVLVNSGRISSVSCYSDKHWICNKPDAHTQNPHF